MCRRKRLGYTICGRGRGPKRGHIFTKGRDQALWSIWVIRCAQCLLLRPFVCLPCLPYLTVQLHISSTCLSQSVGSPNLVVRRLPCGYPLFVLFLPDLMAFTRYSSPILIQSFLLLSVGLLTSFSNKFIISISCFLTAGPTLICLALSLSSLQFFRYLTSPVYFFACNIIWAMATPPTPFSR